MEVRKDLRRSLVNKYIVEYFAMSVLVPHARTAMPLLRRQRMATPKSRRAVPVPVQPLFVVGDDEAQGISSLLDPPTFQYEPFYRVLLHYNQWVDGKQIARLVRTAVPIVSMNDSVRIVEMAERYETAIVVTVNKEDAETYVQRLLFTGLISSMEVA